ANRKHRRSRVGGSKEQARKEVTRWDPRPGKNRQLSSERLTRLSTNAPPRGASLSPEFQLAQEGGSNDKRSRGASSETMGLAHSVGGSDGLFGRRLYQRSDRWAGTRGGATEG